MDVQSVLKRASEKSGFRRARFNEKKSPTSIEDVVIFPFFGDHRSTFILSSLLLRRIKEELKSSKYFVVASWPGNEGLFPYVDEYWQIEDESALERLRGEAVGFANNSSVSAVTTRVLNQFFYDVMSWRDLIPFYDQGITRDFFDRFKHIKLSLPSIPSSASLGTDLSRKLSQKESKIFVYPSRYYYSWKPSGLSKNIVPKDFWIELVSKCASSNFYPVVFSDTFSYDISADATKGCLHIKDIDALRTLSVMRSCGCVLDVFNGISRWALAARVPFVCFDERARFNNLKEYEINDVCGNGIHNEYIFGFGALIDGAGSAAWNSNIFNHLIVKLNKIHSNMNRDLWPSSAESNEIVPYDSVRKVKNKKLGSRFVKVERI